MITQKRFDEDCKILEEMKMLHNMMPNLTEEQCKRLEDLNYKYYVLNDDIRIYWKTY